jgi:hypothetical protein
MADIVASWLIPQAKGSPSMLRKSRLTPVSMASSCCAPNTRLTALVLRHRNLLAVEQGFLAAKTLLAPRPIFHRTDAAIRGHVFCTVLTLVLRKELMDRLAAHHLAVPEWQQAVDDLADLSEIEVEQDRRRALLRPAPGPAIDPLYRAVGISLPPVFQELPRAKATA